MRLRFSRYRCLAAHIVILATNLFLKPLLVRRICDISKYDLWCRAALVVVLPDANLQALSAA